MKNPVWRLLRKNISVWQLGGYALANLVGLTIVLIAVQFYRDATSSRTADGDDPFVSRDYIVVSPSVTGLGSIFSGSRGFGADEIADIKAQPWVEDVGEFTPSRFNVSGSVSIGGMGMSSYLFFESIPDRFFDIQPDGWDFDPSNPNATIPIILSKDYLALYNYGFAASRGLPQISEEIVARVPINIYISGNRGQERRRARIVGFSSRLNTIAVPESFMRWANDKYGDSQSNPDPSRLIIEVNDPGNPAISEYLDTHGLEVSGEKGVNGKMVYLVSIISAVVMTVGAIISVLSFFILMLSIFLLLQKNREKIHDLMMLGYTPRQAAAPYYRLVIILNAVIWVLAIVGVVISSHLWRGAILNLGMTPTSLWVTILIGLFVMAVVTLFNLVTIRRIVRRNF